MFKPFNIIANVSNHHVHLSQQDLDVLFGKNYQLVKIKDLMQPGQFACKETVTVVGPKGKIDKSRIIGPVRQQTQVEISRTEAILLGVNPPVRESGDLVGSSPVKLVGPKGEVSLNEGCIIALRHLHLTPEFARKNGLKDKQKVKILAGISKGREVIFCDVICRVSEKYADECHLDTDEANACLLSNSEKVKVLEIQDDNCDSL